MSRSPSVVLHFRDVEIDETCPECDAPMKLMPSRFGSGGYYLVCTKSPKCKGKGKVSAALQSRINAALAAAPAAPAATG